MHLGCADDPKANLAFGCYGGEGERKRSFEGVCFELTSSWPLACVEGRSRGGGEGHDKEDPGNLGMNAKNVYLDGRHGT